MYSPGETTVKDGEIRSTPKDYRIINETPDEFNKWQKRTEIDFKGAFLGKNPDWVNWRPKPIGMDDTPVEWGNIDPNNRLDDKLLVNHWGERGGTYPPEGKSNYGTKSVAAHYDTWHAFTLCQFVFFTTTGKKDNGEDLNGFLLNSNCGFK